MKKENTAHCGTFPFFGKFYVLKVLFSATGNKSKFCIRRIRDDRFRCYPELHTIC